MVDQRGTTHVYGFDPWGRETQDRVAVAGSGVDGAVRQIETAYEARGMRQRVTSYDNPNVGSGSIVIEVFFEYDRMVGTVEQKPLPYRRTSSGRGELR